jgi:hypothetical protein
LTATGEARENLAVPQPDNPLVKQPSAADFHEPVLVITSEAE